MSASPGKVPHEEVHEQLDPHYFLDYALFGGALRHYVTKSIEDAFHADRNDLHRRFLILGVFKEEHAAYEDLGAILESFIRLKLKEFQHPIEGMLRFKDDLVVIETLFNRKKIKSGTDLFDSLAMQTFIPKKWGETFPQINCERALRRICEFFYHDCRLNQKRQGISAYNKIKHGLVLVSSAKRYDTNLPDAPGVIIRNPDSSSGNPYALLAIPMDDASIEARCKIIEFIQSSLRAIAALYSITRYPEFVSKSVGISNEISLFQAPPLIEVLTFLDQLSNKPK